MLDVWYSFTFWQGLYTRRPLSLIKSYYTSTVFCLYCICICCCFNCPLAVLYLSNTVCMCYQCKINVQSLNMPDTGVSEKLEVTCTRECYFSYLLLRTAFLFMTQKLILVIACAKLGQTVVPCGLGLFRPGTKLWTNNHTVSEKIGEKGIFFLN